MGGCGVAASDHLDGPGCAKEMKQGMNVLEKVTSGHAGHEHEMMRHAEGSQ
jgi:hypothetical protein